MEKFSKVKPYIIVSALFILISYLFAPQVLQKKIVNQPDIASWRGMANEIVTYNESNPDKDPALWTNSMFSGMPATAISVVYEGDYTHYIYKVIHKLGGVRPPSYFVISLFGGFLLFMAFGVNIWLSALGAFMITFASYNMQIIQVGHNSKMVAIAFMPWVLAALVYAYRNRAFMGSLLFAFALSFQIKANHPQITYYLAMMVVAFAISQLVISIRERRFSSFLKTSAMLLLAGVLGIASNTNHLWPTYEYSKFTMRGGSQLATEEGKEQKGLDIAYATSWSYSPGEMPNLMIPNFNGGASVGELSESSATYKAIQSGGYGNASAIVKQMPLYWGPQPFTAGPMYMGAISIFLFFLGIILLKGSEKWWLIGVSTIAILLSWGSHLLPVTQFFFNNIPLYSKFRTVSMILVILQITIPIAGVIALNGIEKVEPEKLKRSMLISLSLTAGLSLIFILIPSLAGTFVSGADSRMPDLIKASLIEDRISLLRSDAFRSLIFIALSAGVIWLWLIGKINRGYFLAGLSILVIADMWSVGKRYLNDSHFVKERDFEAQYQLRPVDKMILNDKDLNYRVLDLSINTFNDSHVSYHHKTIGGYSPAKLQTYQDIIDRHISREMQMIASDISGSTTIEEAQDRLQVYPVLNMLNSRYIVLGEENPPLVNSKAFGNAWFVSEIKEAGSLVDEISALDIAETPHLNTTAIVHKDFLDKIDQISKEPIKIDEERIELVEYSPNKLVYKASTNKNRLALFSEIYYPAGWSAYIDGSEAEIIRANYILRALNIPAGDHTIVFEFAPNSFKKGEFWSRVASGILVITLLLALFMNIRKKKVF